MPRNIKKNMAPKPKAKSDVYKKLPYKDAPKPQAMKQEDIKSPFELGSNRGNDTYSALRAKGLISPVHQEKAKSDKDIKRDREYAMKQAEQAASRRFNESQQGSQLFNAMNTSRIKEGSKPDLKGRVGVFNPETQKASTTSFTTIKDSKANAKAYDQALQNFLESDVDFGRQKQTTYED